METTFKVQTCNGTPEVIKLINGVAKEIVAGEVKPISMATANQIAEALNKTA